MCSPSKQCRMRTKCAKQCKACVRGFQVQRAQEHNTPGIWYCYPCFFTFEEPSEQGDRPPPAGGHTCILVLVYQQLRSTTKEPYRCDYRKIFVHQFSSKLLLLVSVLASHSSLCFCNQWAPNAGTKIGGLTNICAIVKTWWPSIPHSGNTCNGYTKPCNGLTILQYGRFIQYHIIAFHIISYPTSNSAHVAEISKIGRYRRGWLLWVTDGRANPLMDRKGGWSCASWSGCNGCSGHLVGHLTHNCWM